ncbi:MAG: hypothetical protein LBR10_12600 [Prevotellaceae bacterium]|jgi:hypothetical protein|nr:hypothetical protein [Prevotellaceae bacterium]
MQKKKILCIDMDNVLVDFASGIALLSDETKQAYADNPDNVPDWTNSARMTRMNTDTKICVNPENPRHLRDEKNTGKTCKAVRAGKILNIIRK